MSGPGRRRKPNPEEEGSLPAPPRPPAGYGQQAAPAQPEYDYAYDWRQPQAAQPEPQPGPVFDAFSSGSSGSFSQSQGASNDQPTYYNPVGYGLSDPYSTNGTGYAPQPPAPQRPAPQPFSARPAPSQPYSQPSAQPPSVPRPDDVWPDAPPRQPFASYPNTPPAAPPPSAPGRPSAPAARTSPDADALFDENDLFDTGSSHSSAVSSLSSSSTTNAAAMGVSARAPEPPNVTDPVVPPPADGAPPPKDGYTSSDFAFLEEETGQDVKGWLTFVESRAESRADRIKRFRRRLIGAGAVVAVVAAGVGAYALFNGGSLTGGGGSTKSVVLLQISDSTGNAVADALLVTDHSATTGTGSSKTVTGKGAGVLIPSQMIVNSTGFGQQPFGGNMAQSVPAANKDTVADALGVNVDGVWRMDEITFAGLIDEIGGIQLNANVAVPAVTATASPTAAAVPAGNDKLTGGQAVAYATYAAKGEDPDAQIERFGQVVSGLLAALPTDSAAITAYLNHLGIVDDPSLPESKLSPILAALAVEQQAGAFTAKALPLRTDGSNALNVQAAAPIVSSLLGGALNTQNNGQISRVLVEDASGHTGIASQAIRGAAQARLSNSGYTFIDGSTVGHRATSVVEVGSDGAKSAAVQIAATLGLQPDSVKVVSGMSTFADVTVLLGADWPKLANLNLPGTN